MVASNSATQSLLALLQLVSPTLPVGAYTYSEGLETLVQTAQLTDATTLEHWLTQELDSGAIRLEAAVLLRVYHSAVQQDQKQVQYWNHWLSAFRETEELREQSWQMGRSLRRLLKELHPESQSLFPEDDAPCNFATAFAIAAVVWRLDPATTVLGYLQSWAANLINAGVRLIPLGQTQGQLLLRRLSLPLEQAVEAILTLTDEQLDGCSWGVSLASMNHETLYSRLFRS
ncbi:MAG: urease accessory protein UreF [Synechococcales cyanobacterium M58_A2018_015]|nr:urease accessory protein UreF [Synechococcales cyanobacterium M58_A2018_015]